MRDRIVATGLLFTLLLVGLAGLAGCGSSSSKSSSSSSGSSGSSGGGRGVTLSLLGGTGNLNAVACGKQEPFEDYSAPAQVRYTGTVSPAPAPGRWKVKLKL